jgi:hypothetical protein
MVACSKLNAIKVIIVDRNGHKVPEFRLNSTESISESDQFVVRYVQSTLNQEFAVCLNLSQLQKRVLGAEGIVYRIYVDGVLVRQISAKESWWNRIHTYDYILEKVDGRIYKRKFRFGPVEFGNS